MPLSAHPAGASDLQLRRGKHATLEVVADGPVLPTIAVPPPNGSAVRGTALVRSCFSRGGVTSGFVWRPAISQTRDTDGLRRPAKHVVARRRRECPKPATPVARVHIFIHSEHDGMPPRPARPSPARRPRITTSTPGLPVRPLTRSIGPSHAMGTMPQAMPRARAPSDTRTGRGGNAVSKYVLKTQPCP